MANFTWIDWGIVAIVIISALVSFRRGFFKEVLSLLTWLAAVFVAWSFADVLALRLQAYIATPSVRAIVAAVLLFIATLMVGALINRIIYGLVQATGLSGTDRILGMVFGGLRGCLLVVVLVGLMTLAPLQQDSAWQNSVLLPHFLMLADWSRETAMQWVGPLLQKLPPLQPV